MLSDRLIYLAVSLPQVYPPPSLKAFRLCLIFLFFFNLNLNSPSDSVARQNKLFSSFNEEVQSTDAGVQTHLERRGLTSYRCAGRCACLCVYFQGWEGAWQTPLLAVWRLNDTDPLDWWCPQEYWPSPWDLIQFSPYPSHSASHLHSVFGSYIKYYSQPKLE